MILPIYAYGTPVLRKKAQEIDAQYPDLKALLENMWETMYESDGIGLAAPQIGLDIRLFVIDGAEIEGIEPAGFKQVFINAEILEETGAEWEYEEGCLSIPFIRGNVKRQSDVTIRFQDENFETFTQTFTGMAARIIQHEYDHIEGILFTDRIAPLKRQLLKNKLKSLSEGRVNAPYKMKFAKR